MSKSECRINDEVRMTKCRRESRTAVSSWIFVIRISTFVISRIAGVHAFHFGRKRERNASRLSPVGAVATLIFANHMRRMHENLCMASEPDGVLRPVF
ncbi:MAG: hypothetical protein WD065_20905, partial [Planctomycetaceae bacterium]